MCTSRAIRVLLSASCILLSACGSDDASSEPETSPGGASGESDSCCRLGAVCHVAGDDVDPEVRACHDLGHENVQEACDARYEECLVICEGVNDEAVEHSCD